MNSGDIIEMDIWSSFGCFTSPFSNIGGLLTYLIPPKTSIIGMIGSILGYDFNDYIMDGEIKKYKIEELYDIKISIQPLFKLKTRKVTFNSHYGNEPNMLNIKQDVLIDPYYKLFLKFPEHLNSEEKIFLEKIKNNETIYNLYMGRNEFFLNYEYKNVLSQNMHQRFTLNEDNREDFFDDENKIYGTLNRNLIKDTSISYDENETLTIEIGDFGDLLPNYYEYVIKKYPVKRTNFTDFEYIPVSFYTMNKNEDYFFEDIILKENSELDLCNIGENKWISLI
ncbi:MAG: CRISPR-associated protein Cas5 [Methanobrevibacter sp.]|jgi:CRISPR-associated protein Cas5h|nr:CRISPR-associated protein Cas5 [Candidatus Methanoflexus mossambicus]